MKNKKGVSPLIAWVLLIGLSVSMGFLVITWAMQTIPEPEPDFSFCDDVNLFLVNYSINDPINNTVIFNITNNGLFTISKWSFGLINATNVPSQWCDEPNDYSLPPNGNELLIFEMGMYSTPLCDSFDEYGPEIIADPKEIVLVPWITPIAGEDNINCNDRKITITL